MRRIHLSAIVGLLAGAIGLLSAQAEAAYVWFYDAEGVELLGEGEVEEQRVDVTFLGQRYRSSGLPQEAWLFMAPFSATPGYDSYTFYPTSGVVVYGLAYSVETPSLETPLPAAGWIFLAGLGGLAMQRRTRKAA